MKTTFWKTIGLLIMVLIIPIFLELVIFSNNYNSKVSNDGWAGFFGGYIGGIATLLAVFISIEDNTRKLKEQRILDENKESERIRLSVMPYLQTCYDYSDVNFELKSFDFMCFIDEVIIKTRLSRSEIDKIKQSMNGKEYCLLRYTIRNVGIGSAIELKIEINGNDYKADFALPKDDAINVYLWTKLGAIKKRSISIDLYYWDTIKMGHYCHSEKLRFIVEDNEIKVENDGSSQLKKMKYIDP